MPSTAFASAAALRADRTALLSTARSCAPRRARAPHHARTPLRASAEPPERSAQSSARSAPRNTDAAARAAAPRMSSAASARASLSDALADAASRALAALGADPDVAIVFISARYGVAQVGPRGRESLRAVVPRLRSLLPNLRAVIGCTADGVVGAGANGDTEDFEHSPAVSLALLALPGIKVRSFHVMPDDMLHRAASPDQWRSLLGLRTDKPPPAMFVLSDPAFAERGELARLLTGVHAADPRIRAAGAVASAGAAAAGGALLCTLPRDVLDPAAAALRDSGAICLTLEGDVELTPMIAGCMRPVGPVFTACEAPAPGTLPDLHLVGRPHTRMSAAAQLRSVAEFATPEERRLIARDLHIGAADPDAADADGYVIRNVASVDLDAGVVATSATVLAGQSVRFFVKDADTAHDALSAVLQRYKRAELAKSLVGYSNPPFAAFVFSDAERGAALYRERSVETARIAAFVPGVPIFGFFGRAQIAPARTFDSALTAADADAGKCVVHNAASVIVLLRRRSGLSPINPPDSPGADDDEKSIEK